MGYAQVLRRAILHRLFNICFNLFRLRLDPFAQALLTWTCRLGRSDPYLHSVAFRVAQRLPRVTEPGAARDRLLAALAPVPGLADAVLSSFALQEGDLACHLEAADRGVAANPESAVIGLYYAIACSTRGDRANERRALRSIKPLRDLTPVHRRIWINSLWRAGLVSDAAHWAGLGPDAALTVVAGRDNRRALTPLALDVAAGNLDRAIPAARLLAKQQPPVANVVHIWSAMLATAGPDHDLAQIRQAYDLALAAAPYDSLQADLARLRDRLLALRDRVARTTKPAVALICPIHRSENLPTALSQLARQRDVDGTAVLAINNTTGIDADAVRATWRGAIPLQVIDIGAQPNVGAALNAAIAATDAPFLIRMDSDCHYGPRYAADMIDHAVDQGAGVVLKRAKFRYWQQSGLTDLEEPGKAFCWAGPQDSGGGSALGFHRAVWQAVPFCDRTRISEDVAFIRQTVRGGHGVYMVDPFNHLSIRDADTDAHTYNVGDLFTQVGDVRHLIAAGELDERHVIVSGPG